MIMFPPYFPQIRTLRSIDDTFTRLHSAKSCDGDYKNGSQRGSVSCTEFQASAILTCSSVEFSCSNRHFITSTLKRRIVIIVPIPGIRTIFTRNAESWESGSLVTMPRTYMARENRGIVVIHFDLEYQTIPDQKSLLNITRKSPA